MLSVRVEATNQASVAERKAASGSTQLVQTTHFHIFAMQAASYSCDETCSNAFIDGHGKRCVKYDLSRPSCFTFRSHDLLHKTYKQDVPLGYQHAGINMLSTLSIASLAAPSFSKCTKP